MGIRGLESYIEKNCPHALLNADLAQIVSLHKRNTGQVPILLVDGNACSRQIYRKISSAGAYLGLYEEFEEQLDQLIGSCKRNGIRVIFFFDGSPPINREKLWVERRCQSVNRIIEATRLLECGRGYEAEETIEAELSAADFFRYLLRLKDCEIIQSIKDADIEIMEFIAEHGCCGVLSQDTDFIIFQGVDNYFPAKHLNFSRLRGKRYCKKSLATHFGIKEMYFPVLATLCGNDIVSDADLRSFHLKLLRNKPNFITLQRAIYLPKQVLIPRVAQWLRDNSSSLETPCNPSTWPNAIAELLNAPELEEKFGDSIQSYLLPVVSKEPDIESGDEVWPQILHLAEKRHRWEGMRKEILSVLISSKFFCGCNFEYFTNPNYPPSGSVLKPLRQRIYGILLQERPLGPCYVTEIIVTGPNILTPPAVAYYECPDDHPGLLHLWGRSTQEDQLKMLCFVVSDRLSPDKILKIPENLRIACLALFYLAREVRSGLQRRHVEALIVHLIRLAKISLAELKSIRCGPPDNMVQIHIGSLYMSTWQNVLTAHDACGSPFLNKFNRKKNTFFDGKLFNEVYRAMSMGTQGSNLCDDKSLFKRIIAFLYTYD